MASYLDAVKGKRKAPVAPTVAPPNALDRMKGVAEKAIARGNMGPGSTGKVMPPPAGGVPTMGGPIVPKASLPRRPVGAMKPLMGPAPGGGLGGSMAKAGKAIAAAPKPLTAKDVFGRKK